MAEPDQDEAESRTTDEALRLSRLVVDTLNECRRAGLQGTPEQVFAALRSRGTFPDLTAEDAAILRPLATAAAAELVERGDVEPDFSAYVGVVREMLARFGAAALHRIIDLVADL